MARILRPYTGGLFALELENGNEQVAVGFVNSIDGGHFKSDEIKYSIGHDNYLVFKGPGKPKYEEITLTVGTANSAALWDWIKASLDNEPERRSGAIVVYDLKMRERQRRTFKNALISEIGFPGLDATSKAAVQLTLKIAPEQLTYDTPSGSKHTSGPGYGQGEIGKQKRWLACNFRFTLDKFKDDPAFRHAKVEAFTVKQPVLTENIGHMIESLKEPGRLEIPNVQVSFPMAHIKPWMDWYKTACVDGNWPDAMTTGSITYYGSDSENTELATVSMEGVGINSLEYDKLEAHKDGIAKVKATLTVEKMELKSGDGTV